METTTIKQIKFSIIVPVYNVEKYLARCLDSILTQTYSNYEVICVNDGSTDRSLQILEDYSQKDKRVTIVSKQNAGLGEARNTGLEHASGDYVWFVDSDDWIEKNALVTLADTMEQTNYLNAYIIDMLQTDDKTFQSVTKSCFRNQGEIPSSRYAKDLLLYNALFFAQNKIYRFDFIKNYRFNTGFYEDVPQLALFAKSTFTVYILHEPLYFYYSRPDSIMKTVDNRVLDIFKQLDTIYDELYRNEEFQIFCTHMFYYSVLGKYKTIEETGNKELLSNFVCEYNKRKKRYMPVTNFLFFKEISLRRKLKLVSGVLKIGL